ncbi:hypothetical protein RRG08_044383 [Elysia crispata]|uniref:Uncharacterized protein n=1 Tax=Elysia crispata TaxID=231223 RepID=A0AAE0YNY3_9GAST|nr:hypothetical protein RRG08_044383 [Elysia crispata]
MADITITDVGFKRSLFCSAYEVSMTEKPGYSPVIDMFAPGQGSISLPHDYFVLRTDYEWWQVHNGVEMVLKDLDRKVKVKAQRDFLINVTLLERQLKLTSTSEDPDRKVRVKVKA